jgi:secreted trypsin-like serine protease
VAVLAGLARLLLSAALLSVLGASPASAVFGGKALRDGDPLAKAVAAILYRDDTGAHLCTAVALGPRLLLTAAHCTAGDHSTIKVIFGTTLTDVGNDRIRFVSAVARAGKTAAGKGKYAYQDPDDIALVVLGSGAPAGTRFVSLADASPAPVPLTIVGYGATSELRKPDALGQRQLGFDGILRVAAMPLSKVGPALLVGDQSQGTGACTGDSGGPAFVGQALVGVLIGVSSPRANNDYCRGTAWFANLARWRDWIETTARELGQPMN